MIKNYLARLGTIGCIHDMQWFMPCTTCNLQAPRAMLKKSLENGLRITVRSKKTISSIARNSPNSENAKIQNLKGNTNHTKLPTLAGDIHPSWATYTPQESSGNHHESPCAYGKYKVPKPAIHTETLQRIIVRLKRLRSTVQPRLSASSFNSLIDLSLR